MKEEIWYDKKMFGTQRTWGEFYEAVIDTIATTVVQSIIIVIAMTIGFNVFVQMTVEGLPKICSVVKAVPAVQSVGTLPSL